MKIFLRILAIILLINLSFGAIYGGWMLVSDPSGGKFGWTIDLLAGTPFKTFLIPGIFLLVVLGNLSLVIVLLTIVKAKNYEWFIIIQGGILIAWLTIEIIMNNDLFEPIMHYPSYITGILLVIIGIILLKKYIISHGTAE